MTKRSRQVSAEAATVTQRIWDGKDTGSQTPAQPDVSMSTQQVADYLGVSEDVARSLFRSKRMRAFKVGGQWRVYAEDLMDYIMKQLQKS